MKKIISIIFLILNAGLCTAQYLIQSPNEKLRVTLHSNRARKGASKFLVPKKMEMMVFNEHQILAGKEIGITVKADGHRYSFGKSEIAHANKGTREVDDPKTADPLLADLKGRYNSLTLGTKSGIVLELRVYNNGVAYRFRVSGYDGDYKILDVCDAFPGEKPIAILGTFTGEYVFPWRTMKVEGNGNDDNGEWADVKISSDAFGRGTRIVPWKDALSSVSVGVSFDWHSGDTWGDFSDTHNIRADFTYKYIYGGISVSPCQEIQYIYYEKDFWPFEKLAGGIDSWSLGARAGFCLPLQNGYEVWNIIPYVAASVMHLHQHGDIRPGYKTLDKHNHYLVGPGIKVQCAFRDGLSMGLGYECQFFTDKKAPTAMHSLLVSFGKTF